uniref:Uncharacterized protein n=1 Tax=Anguilla anguilla TaxID=7936 RepID=A0A0E9VR13_ANGAN
MSSRALAHCSFESNGANKRSQNAVGFLPPLAFEKRITDGEKHRCSPPLLAPDVWNY